MSNDSGGSPGPKCWRCAVCKETVLNIAANSYPTCPFCDKNQPGYPTEPTLNPSTSPASATAQSLPGGQVVPTTTSDRSASGAGTQDGGDFIRSEESQHEVLAQQRVQPTEETSGPQQPRPVVLSREQQQLLHYRQQLTENQRMYSELKQKYDQEMHSMESFFHGRQDQSQQLMEKRILCEELGNHLRTMLKHQQELQHQVIMLGGVSEQQQLLEYEQQLFETEGQLKQQLEQELHCLESMELNSGGQQFGPDQQQQLLGQKAFCQQLKGNLQTVCKRRQDFWQKFMLQDESAPQGSSQGQKMILQGESWVPVPEDPEQQQQHQRGMRPKWVLQGEKWIPMAPDQQQQQKELEVLQQKHSVDAQQKEIKEKHEEIEEERKEERMEIKGEGVQHEQQKTSQEQNVEQLHKQQEMIIKQQQTPQDPGEHDQQPRDEQQQQKQQGEEGGQQPNYDQQKQNEQEIQMLLQKVRSLELQVLQQQRGDGQRPSHDQQNQHQQNVVQTPHREAEGGSQQSGNSQQEQEKRMLEQQQETHLQQGQISWRHQPSVSQPAMVFGKPTLIPASIQFYQPTQVHSGGKENLSAADDEPPATMPQQGSLMPNPQGSPATGVSGALPSNQGSDGSEDQPIVGQSPGVPDSAWSTKASGQGSHAHPLSAEDAAAQNQANVSIKQELDDDHNASDANGKGANQSAGLDAGGENKAAADEDPKDITNGKSDATNKKDQEVAYLKPKEPSVLLPPKAKGSSKKFENVPSGPNVCTDGLKASPEKSVKVTFHVLVPKACWEWDSATLMHIRFGHPKLGPWTDCGTFEEIRGYGDVSEMVCTFENFDRQILKTPLPYKYVIHSPKEKKPEDCYEYLHAHSSYWNEYNRCLLIQAKDRHFPTGEYHKYDCIAYPRSTKISKSSREYAKGVVSFVSGGLIFGNSDPLSDQAMSEASLECYLLRIKEILCNGSFPDGYDINSIAMEILFIYESLCEEYVSLISDPISDIRVWSIEKRIIKKLQLWFESIIVSLAENRSMNPIKRLVCALCVTHCIKMPSISVLYKIQDVEKFLIPLAGMLALHPDGDVKAEYKQICSHIPVEHRPTVADAISKLCSRVAGTTVKKFTIEWLLAIPLYHFLEKESQPYGKMKFDGELDWKLYNTKFEMASVTAKNMKEKSFVATYYNRAKGYFAVDPLFPKLFAYLVPKTDFTALCNCELVPPYLSIEVLVKRALLPIHPNEEVWITDIEQVKLHHVAVCYSEPEYLSAMVKSSVRLCTKLSKKIRNREENQVKVLRSAFSCVLCAIEKACTLCEEEDIRDKSITEIRNLLKDWIADKRVIGGYAFGYYLTRSNSNWKGKEELKVWQCLLSLELPKESHNISTDWQNIIGDLVKDRIQNLDDVGLELIIK